MGFQLTGLLGWGRRLLHSGKLRLTYWAFEWPLSALKSQVCLEDLQTSILSSSWWSPRPRRTPRPPSALKGSCQIDSDDERIPRYLREEGKKSTKDYWTENTFSLLLQWPKKNPKSRLLFNFSNSLVWPIVGSDNTVSRETKGLNHLTFFCTNAWILTILKLASGLLSKHLFAF